MLWVGTCGCSADVGCCAVRVQNLCDLNLSPVGIEWESMNACSHRAGFPQGWGS